MTSESLTSSLIHDVMDEAITIDDGTVMQKLKGEGLILRRAKDRSDWVSLLSHAVSSDKPTINNSPLLLDGNKESSSSKDYLTTSLLQLQLPFHFGMTLHSNSIGDTTNTVCGCITFNIAYSTWEGKFLYIDRIFTPNSRKEDDDGSSIEVLLLQILARIAGQLNCARLVWRHKNTSSWYKSTMKNPPQTLNEILTLFLDQPAMKKYTLESSKAPGGDSGGGDRIENQEICVQEGGWTPELIQTALRGCLDISNANSKEFRLRLATRKDLDTVDRLIHGLADYVKEPEEVHTTSDDYLRDGFSDDPLFYCLLVDRIVKEDDNGGGVLDGASNAPTEDEEITTSCPSSSYSYYTCGYAAVYFGYVIGEGRFLYLEDLFLEVDHRKLGGGSLVMQTLTRIALTLQCSRLYWQALDWNTAALKFYDAMGATIQQGVVTTRYCGNSLQDFASHGVGKTC